MKTFYIISTTNAELEGWFIFGTYKSKIDAEKDIFNIDAFIDKSELHRDIEAQTLLKNSRIVSKTEAKRKYHCCADHVF